MTARPALGSSLRAAALPGERKSANLPTFAAAAALAMLLAMTIGTAVAVRGVVLSQSQARFEAFASQAAAEVNAEVSRSLTELAAIEAFGRIHREFDAGSFETFANTVGRQGAGVQALGLAPRVPESGAAAFDEFAARSGYDSPVLTAGTLRPEYFPLAYLVPPQPGLLRPGRELGADPVYGPLLETAMREGRLVASAPAQVPGHAEGQAVFVTFSPIFVAGQGRDKGGDVAADGFAIGVYRVGDFLARPAEKSGLAGVTYRVLDRDASDTEVFPAPGGNSAREWGPGLTVSETVEVAGRQWDIQLLSPPLYGLRPVEREVWKIVLAAGLALALFATGSAYSLLKSRQEARTDLQLMTNQLRVILDSALEGILLVDRSGRIIWANQAFADAFGFGGASLLIGADWASVYRNPGVDLAERDAFVARIQEIFQSQTVEIASEDIQFRPPSDRTLAMTSAPVTDHKGGYLGRLWVFRDVSRERQAVHSQSVFISMVSHELRTPLTSLTGFIELALDGAGGPLNEQAARLLRIARSNGERLNRLVSDILEVTRLETGHLALEPVALDVREVVRDLVESMSAEFERRRQSLSTDLDSGLPFAWADRQRTAQIIANLMTNAYRYTPDGGKVTISAHSDVGQVIVTVTDTGLGIPVALHERIFEKFARVETLGPRPQGSTGLGLAITKALVELQGGRIRVHSEPGKGSAFTFSLPLAPASPVHAGGPSSPIEAAGAAA
jgi:PAS domain S-box-containing protein